MSDITVCIVEDDFAVRQMITEWVSGAEGFRFLKAFGNGEAAMQELPQTKSDLVLMDINLPQVSGIECVRALKPLMPGTQFLMLTIYSDTDHIFDALAAGATGYMLKKIRRDALLKSLAEASAGGSPMSSAIARKVVQSFQTQPVVMPEDCHLPPRQREVLELLARGYLYKEIADALCIKQVTVNCYIREIYEKLHVHSRTQAVVKYNSFSEPKRPAVR
jgi:DNA-binding NarL/FixJ family response regulator